MTFNEYKELANKTAVYRQNISIQDGYITRKQIEHLSLAYVALGITGEAGEIANKLKKLIRGDYQNIIEIKSELIYEIGDVLWYLNALANELDVSLDFIAKINIDKLNRRKEKKTLNKTKKRNE